MDETYYIRSRTLGECRGVHHKTLMAAAFQVHYREASTAQDKRKDGRYAVRAWLFVSVPTAALFRCAASSRAPSCQAR